MGDALGLLGALGFVGAFIMAIVRVTTKKGLAYRQIGAVAAASVVVFFTGAVIAGPTSDSGRGVLDDANIMSTAPKNNMGDGQIGDEEPVESRDRPAPEADAGTGGRALVEGVGVKLMEVTEGHQSFSDVTDIKVYQRDDEVLGNKVWAEVHTSYTKDWDDDGYCEEKARLTILQAFTNEIIHLDEARVFNADGIQVASMQNWLPKE